MVWMGVGAGAGATVEVAGSGWTRDIFQRSNPHNLLMDWTWLGRQRKEVKMPPRLGS